VKYYTNKARQAGMTLIELTVVLLVLIGLAGLMMPYVSGFISKTHDSTGASNIAEVNGAMERYSAQFQGYPDDLDSLLNADGTLYGTAGSLLMGPRCLKSQALTAGQASTLTMSGISSILEMNGSTSDATFDAVTFVDGAPKSVSIATDVKVAMLSGVMNCAASSTDMTMLSDENLRPVLVRTPNILVNDYVVFGVGQNSSMMGKVMMSAPVHFAQSGAMSAKSKYNRFGVVFEVPKEAVIANKGYCSVDTMVSSVITNTTVYSTDTDECNGLNVAGDATDNVVATWIPASASMQARFAGSVMLMPMVEGLQSAMQRHYDAAAGG